MKRFVSLTATTALALVMATQAFATDYDSGVVTKAPSPEYTDVEFGSGWYLRGDISYNIRGESESSLTSLQSSVGPFLTQTDYDDSVGARIGFGYYISPNIRLEASAEQIFDSNFDGIRSQNFGGSRDVQVLTSLTPGAPPTPVTDVVTFNNQGNVISTNGFFTGTNVSTIPGSEEIQASYNASSFIVSGYYDLPAIGKFKPYVGAGVGLGRISYNERRILTCTADASESCGFPLGAQGEEATIELVRNEEFWAGAYQLGFGTGIQIDDHWTADVGYTFTEYGDGGELSYEDGTAIDEDGFEIHQVRVGLRYDLW